MKKSTRLIFTGDIGFDHYMDHKWEDEELLDSSILRFFDTADHVIANVEGPLFVPDGSEDSVGTSLLKHGMDPEAAAFLRKIHSDVWNICNNHIMDNGPAGMRSTLKVASLNNAITLGAGMNIEDASKPVILDCAGGIGLIGVGYQRACRKADENTPGCFSWSDMNLIKKQIEFIKAKCRWCVVVAHGGEEFTALPSPYTRNRYIDYLNMGADIVVSHHPHVPLNYETFKDKAIFYSLGNLIFDTDYQRSQFNTEKGILLGIDFTEDKFSFEAMGITINRKTERVEKGELPKIFVDVNEEEYNKLVPLAAKMLIRNTKRQLLFLKPEQFKNATEKEWYDNFYEPLRSGRVPGEILDFQIIYPLSLEADKEVWKQSSLEGVKEYILEQLD